MCVVSEDTNIPHLSLVTDDAITWGGIQGLSFPCISSGHKHIKRYERISAQYDSDCWLHFNELLENLLNLLNKL